MGWSLGYDDNWQRDIGYGVPAICDHPECNVEIHRGLSYVCGGEPYGGQYGCGLFFCEEHREWVLGLLEDLEEPVRICERCEECHFGYGASTFPPKLDVLEWVEHKLTDDSWEEWREDYPEEVEALKKQYNL